MSMMPQSMAPGALGSIAPGSIAPGSVPPGSSPPGSGSSPPPERSDVARVIAPFLRKMAGTTDPEMFKSIVAPLAAKIRELVSQGHIATVWRVRSTLEMIASEPAGPGGPSRAPYATKLLELFAEQTLLLQIAERSLDGIEDKEGHARNLVVHAGLNGAYALYSARLKRGVFEARERFVATVQQLGVEGSPMIRAALERLESRLELPGAVEVVEDLIKSVPRAADDAMGQLLGRFAKSTFSSIAHLATMALTRAWGNRARPLLVFLLTHTEDRVAIAAISGMRGIGAIDEQGVRKLEPLVLGTEGQRMPVRIAAAEALNDATPGALPAARTMLGRALSSVPSAGTTSEVEDFIVVVSRTILAIGGDGGLVAERWRNSGTWLRARLESLLRGRTSAG
jgi:hypothetical protein